MLSFAKSSIGAIAFSVTGGGLLTGRFEKEKNELGDIRNIDPLFHRECFQSGLRVAKKIAEKIMNTYEPKFVDLLIRGGRVDHVHIILQPEYEENDPQNTMFRLFEALMETKFPDDFLDQVYAQLK